MLKVDSFVILIDFISNCDNLLVLVLSAIFWLFVGELFFDAGNVWAGLSDFRIEEIRYTTGVGLALITPLGPIRLDYGYKLNKRKIDASPDAFHLGIYFAF